jgi:hypothetical protein
MSIANADWLRQQGPRKDYHNKVVVAAIMANPRKFSEKIALHNQKQAEETAAFEAIMREVSGATKVRLNNFDCPVKTRLHDPCFHLQNFISHFACIAVQNVQCTFCCASMSYVRLLDEI